MAEELYVIARRSLRCPGLVEQSITTSECSKIVKDGRFIAFDAAAVLRSPVSLGNFNLHTLIITSRIKLHKGLNFFTCFWQNTLEYLITVHKSKEVIPFTS